MTQFESKKIRYSSADTPNGIYRQIRQGADDYFKKNQQSRKGTPFLFFKILIFSIVIAVSLDFLCSVYSFSSAFVTFMLLGFSSLFLGITIGHDAAHQSVTGHKRLDNFIFQFIFGLQGVSGYMWQIRHNYSHHALPNVIEYDSDMEISSLLLLEPNPEKAKWFHAYQHLYAPFLYMSMSCYILFLQDFKFFTQKEQANLIVKRIPLLEWVKMIGVKIVYFSLYLGLPMTFAPIHFTQLLGAFVLMHALISVFLAFTFFISHHVMEIAYVEAGEKNDFINDAWIRHQIITTIDFNAGSTIANFIFGGFNTHIAHHVFPEISHVHYPALTRIIQNTLTKNNLDWYKSFTFWEGCVSHLKHLKTVAQIVFETDKTYTETSQTTIVLAYENSNHFDS